MRLIVQPNGAFRLGDFLQRHLQDPNWREFKAAVAFAKRSGTKHIRADLRAFSARGLVKLAVGVDCRGTSREGLEDLLSTLAPRGEVYVFHNELESTFHPKVYVFRNDQRAALAIGSGNLTEGGLFTNYEASIALELDLSSDPDRGLFEEVEANLASWMDARQPTVRRLSTELITQLVQQQYVLPEERTLGDEPHSNPAARPQATTAGIDRLFARVAVKRAPWISSGQRRAQPRGGRTATAALPAVHAEGFVMTLGRTDVGRGQTTPGTARRSPEIFIPLGARDHAPAFWGWPAQFQDTPTKADRPGVLMRIGTSIVQVNMMAWKRKHDLRLRSEALRSAGQVGDIMRIVKTDPQVVGYSYDVDVVKRGSRAFASHLALCTYKVPGTSRKKWGYY